jgi:hypothetical protein
MVYTILLRDWDWTAPRDSSIYNKDHRGDP